MSPLAKTDFGLIPVIDVARQLFGNESRDRSNHKEKHFSDHGGLFVNAEKNKWYSHGHATGGDAVSLVQFANNCDFKEALEWLRLHSYLADHQSQPQKRIVSEYDYVNEDGELRYQVVRYRPRGFRQRRPVGDDWAWGLKGGAYRRSTPGDDWYRVNGPVKVGDDTIELPSMDAVPYRLPELLQSGEAPVLLPGGEKDVDNLHAVGFTATCNHGGEGKWWPELTPHFKNRCVFILCDNDEMGEKHQRVVGAALNDTASEIRVVRFSELPSGGDVSDWIEGRRKDGLGDDAIHKVLEERLGEAPLWEAAAQPTPNDLQAGGSVSEDDWPAPVSLPEGLSPVAPFDPALLPDAVRPWVRDISERMQCPSDYVAVATLVAGGAVLGRKVAIRPQRRTDWYEVANLWGCIVGRPGDLKSPAITEAFKPLRRLEANAAKWFEAKTEQHREEREVWELKRDAAKNDAKNKLKKNAKAHIEPFDIPEPDEPVERRYVTNDTTYEKLGEIMAQNPNGVLAHRDELVSLLKTLDREENAAARGFFLTAWSGTQPYKFDRITRNKTHIEATCLSLLGTTQPGRLSEYVRRAHSGGAGDDGLIQRFGLLVWPDQKPTWENVDRYPNSEAKEAAYRCFDSFDSLQPGDVGAETDDFETMPFLRFDEAAQVDFDEWRWDHEGKLRSDALAPAMASHLAKYRGLVPALALINHLADGGRGLVGQPALLRALGLVEYLETHARRAYGAGAEAEVAAAKAILTHIRKGDIEDSFRARDIHRRNWSKLTDRGQVQAGIDLLCDLDWLRAEDNRGSTGGRPTTRYRINPRAHQ